MKVLTNISSGEMMTKIKKKRRAS